MTSNRWPSSAPRQVPPMKRPRWSGRGVLSPFMGHLAPQRCRNPLTGRPPAPYPGAVDFGGAPRCRQEPFADPMQRGFTLVGRNPGAPLAPRDGVAHEGVRARHAGALARLGLPDVRRPRASPGGGRLAATGDRRPTRDHQPLRTPRLRSFLGVPGRNGATPGRRKRSWRTRARTGEQLVKIWGRAARTGSATWCWSDPQGPEDHLD